MIIFSLNLLLIHFLYDIFPLRHLELFLLLRDMVPFLENPGNHIFKSTLKTKNASPSRLIIPFCFVIVFVRENMVKFIMFSAKLLKSPS